MRLSTKKDGLGLFGVEPFKMGCFLGGVVGLWLSCFLLALLGFVTDFYPSLTPVCLGMFLLWLDESISLFQEDQKKEDEESGTFLRGLLAGPAFFWGIVAIVLTSGLIYLVIKPLERVPKTLRRQFCLLLVVWMSALGLYQQVSGAIFGLADRARVIDQTSLHTLGPGQYVRVQSDHVTRLNDDYWVAEVNRQLVLISSGADDAEALSLTGLTVPVPDAEDVYGEISSELRVLRKRDPQYDYPLFDEAMVHTGSLQLSALWHIFVIVGAGLLVSRLVRQSSDRSVRPGALGAIAGVLMVLSSLGGLCYLEKEHRAARLELADFVDEVKPVPVDKVDPANDGFPITITGKLVSGQPIVDKPFGVKLPGKLTAYREVSMLQDEEIWSGSGDDERVTGYRQIWSDEHVQCPSKPNRGFPVAPEFFVAAQCKVGAYTIPPELVAELRPRKPVNPPLKLEKSLADLGRWKRDKGYDTLSCDDRHGKASLRVRYLVQEPTVVTVMGMQKSGTLEPYIGKNGGEIFSISRGHKPAANAKVWAGSGALPFEIPQNPWVFRILLGPPIWIGLFLLLSCSGSNRTDASHLLLSGLAMVLVEALGPALVAAIRF